MLQNEGDSEQEVLFRTKGGCSKAVLLEVSLPSATSIGCVFGSSPLNLAKCLTASAFRSGIHVFLVNCCFYLCVIYLYQNICVVVCISHMRFLVGLAILL